MAVNNPNTGIVIPFATVAQAQAGVSQNTVISPFTLEAVIQPIQDAIAGIEGINDLQAFTSEVNAIEAGVGLQADGTYVTPVGTAYLGATTTVKGGLVALDTNLNTVSLALSSEISNRINDVNDEETRALAAESALQTELNTTQTGAGLNANGSYTAPVGSNYLGSATTLKGADVLLDTQVKQVRDQVDAILLASDADKDSFAEIVALINSVDTVNDQALATFVGNVNSSMGGATNGTKANFTSTNYVAATDSYNVAVNKIDAAMLDLQGQLDDVVSVNETQALQSELDITQLGAGLEDNGTYIANPTGVYIDDAVSLKDADNKLDAQLHTTVTALGQAQNAIVDMQTEIDKIEAGAGLLGTGDYLANASSNYLTTAVSLKDADNKLDAKLRLVEIDVIALQGDVGQHDSDIAGIATELNNIETAVGLADAGTKTDFSSTNVITGNSSFKAAIEALDTYVGNMEGGNGTIALQSEVDAIETTLGVMIDATGNFVQPDGSRYYIDAATSISNAIELLDTGLNTTATDLQNYIDAPLNLTADQVLFTADGETFAGSDALKFKNYAGTGLSDKTLVIDGDPNFATTIKTAITAAATYTGGYAGLTVQNKSNATSASANIYLKNEGPSEVADYAVLGLEGKLYNSNSDYMSEKAKALYLGNSNGDITIMPNFLADEDGGSVHLTYENGVKAVSITNSGALSTTTTFDIPTQEYQFQTGSAGDVLLSGGANAAMSWTAKSTFLSDVQGDIDGLQTEVDAIETAVGLTTTGTKTNFASEYVITANASFKTAIEELDTYVQGMEAGNGTIALQEEVDRIETAVGLADNGQYSAHVGSNYLDTATSVKVALGNLDTEIKALDTRLDTAESDIADLQTAIDNQVSGVSAVNGETGDVTLTTDDIDESLTPTNKWYTAARVVTDVLVNNTDNDEEDKSPTVHAIKAYVDAQFNQAIKGLDYHAPCKTASTGSNINIASAPAAIGGYTFTANGERVLLKDQTDATQNGIYDWNGTGSALTRSDDSNDIPDGEVTGGMFTFIQDGDLAGTSWVLTIPVGGVILETDELTFAQFGSSTVYTGDTGISISGTSINLDLNELSAKTTLGATDKFALADASDGGNPKTVTLSNLANKLGGTDLVATAGVLSVDSTSIMKLAGTQTVVGNKTFSGSNTFSGTNTVSGSIALGSTATATTQASTDSSTKVATTEYVTTAIDAVEAVIGANGTMIFKGNYDATAGTPSLATAKKGHYYNVSVAGTLAGVTLNTTDQLLFVNDVAGGVVQSTDFILVDNTETPISTGTLPVVKIGANTQAQAGIYYVVDSNSNFSVAVPTKAMVGGKTGGVWYIRHRGTGTITVTCTGVAGGEFLWYPGDSLTPGATFGVKSITLTRAGEYKFVASQIDGAASSFVQWDVTVNNNKALRTTDDLTEGSSNRYATAATVRPFFSSGTGISYTSSTGVIALNATLDNLSNVDETGKTSGQFLKYDGASWVPATVNVTGANFTWPTTALSTGTTAGVVGNYYYTSTTTQGTAYTITPPSPGNAGDVLYIHNLGGNTINFGPTTFYYNGVFNAAGSTFTSSENDVFVFTRFNTSNVWLISKQVSHPRVSAGTGLSLNSTTGVLTNTISQYTDTLARSAAVVNSMAGTETNQAPSVQSIKDYYTASTGITLTNGAIATTITQYTNENAQDTVGAALVAGNATNTGIQFTYGDTEDTANRINATVSLSGFSIDALSDVDTSTTAPNNGEALVWNSSSNKFVPGVVASGTSVNTTNCAVSSNTTATTDNAENYYIATAAMTLTLPTPSSSNVGKKVILKSYTTAQTVIASNSGQQIIYDSASPVASITMPQNFAGFCTTLICLQVGSGVYFWVVI